jgi:hypothetical protein
VVWWWFNFLFCDLFNALLFFFFVVVVYVSVCVAPTTRKMTKMTCHVVKVVSIGKCIVVIISVIHRKHYWQYDAYRMLAPVLSL